MDLTQRKLSKAEWNSIETPVSSEELRIIKLIMSGYNNVNAINNPTMSLLKYMKISYTEQNDKYIYIQYLQPTVKQIHKENGMYYKELTIAERSMKKADIIRLTNTEKQLQGQKSKLFEFILLELLGKLVKEYNSFLSNKSKYKWMNTFYTLNILKEYNVELVNKQLISLIEIILQKLMSEVDLNKLIYNGKEIIEQNVMLLKYADETLYDHQKQLFTLCKQPNPKLLLYIAPTGTGKTMSPLGLSEKHKVIFVCAARHVGLALAKAAVSAHKKIAFAFGCNDAEDIRLHYYAAKEYSINKKSGGIGKVDNSVGDKVEIIISDIQSYLPAMYYMLAFNKKEDIIMYWDEPTITLDYKEHEFHEIIKTNWIKNIIPNVVLSSATLPQKEDIIDTINDFCGKFKEAEVHDIVSYDCKKTIPLINKDCYVEMPHYLSNDYNEIQKIVKHCLIYKTLLRYIDLGEAIKFIKYINEHNVDDELLKTDRFCISIQFSEIELINMNNIKLYYLNILGNIHSHKWEDIYKHMISLRDKKYSSNIHIATRDAKTLTDGPTIFIADNVEKIAQFYIQHANIPQHIIKDIMSSIDFNSVLNEKIAKETKDLEDGLKKDEGKEKKSGNTDRMNPEMKQKMKYIQQLQSATKLTVLDPQYIPNTREHLYKHSSKYDNDIECDNIKNKPFTCNVSEEYVGKIMQIDDIADNWKLLLMMGIGVFTKHKSDRYTELMKTLVQEQKLYLIIASSDFVYGTNYQFCHGYISKDMGNMSQEKCIQSMGRVGRNKLQYDYSIRFRDDELIYKLFTHEENKPEVYNMSLLFNDS